MFLASKKKQTLFVATPYQHILTTKRPLEEIRDYSELQVRAAF